MIKQPQKFTADEAYKYLDEAPNVFWDQDIGRYCKDAARTMYNWNGPASTKHHHVYKGGLLVHTAEVLYYTKLLAGDLHEELVYAAILHDHKKTLDYHWDASDQKWHRTQHGNQIYHVAEGYASFKAAMSNHPNPSRVDRIGHMILSHHGRPEWGSAIEPQTKEADILHLADRWSVHYGPGRVESGNQINA